MPTKAPQFSGEDVRTGKPFSLAQHKGEIVVISFNGLTWCVPCQFEAPILASLWKEYALSTGLPRVQFVMVFVKGHSPTTINALQDAIQQFGITMPVIVDDGIFSAYTPSSAVPQVFFVNPEQDVCGNKIGAHPPEEALRLEVIQHVIDCGGSGPRPWKPALTIPVPPFVRPGPPESVPQLDAETRDILVAMAIDDLAKSMTDPAAAYGIRSHALASASSALSRRQLRLQRTEAWVVGKMEPTSAASARDLAKEES